MRMVLNFIGDPFAKGRWDCFMDRRNYQTVGRQRLVAYLSAHPDRQFTVDELCLAVNGDPSSGKSSLYRQLSALCNEETVRKFRNDARGCSVYQYIGGACSCRDCFHAKCLRCGRLEHLDCGDSVIFARHLMAEHGFAIDCGQSVLYGICRSCMKRAEGKRFV